MSSKGELWSVWASMIQRCFNPKRPAYQKYGGRGITVCSRWLNYKTFEQDMLPRSIGLSLDRIDNEGHYEPSNCRWATRTEQALNRRSNVMIEHNGVTKHESIWCAEMGLGAGSLSKRLKRGWTLEQTMTLPQGTRI